MRTLRVLRYLVRQLIPSFQREYRIQPIAAGYTVQYRRWILRWSYGGIGWGDNLFKTIEEAADFVNLNVRVDDGERDPDLLKNAKRVDYEKTDWTTIGILSCCIWIPFGVVCIVQVWGWVSTVMP